MSEDTPNADGKSPYHITNIHDFKTHLSKYIRMLRSGEVEGVVVRRYRRKLVMLISIEQTLAKKARREQQAREQGSVGPDASMPPRPLGAPPAGDTIMS